MEQTGRSPGEDVADEARTTLSVDLMEHADEIVALMVRPEAFGSLGEGADWLRERYAEIAPTVVPDALDCVGTGRRLSPESLRLVRASALAARGQDVPFAVVLRGAVPALRAVAAFARTSPRVPPGDVAVLLGRAALVAQELGACWAEHWADARGAAVPAAEVVAVAAACPEAARGPDEHEVRMLALAADGRSTEQIAVELAYSPQAVKWHFARLMRAWRVQNRVALVATAFVRGVLVVTGRRVDPPRRQLGR